MCQIWAFRRPFSGNGQTMNPFTAASRLSAQEPSHLGSRTTKYIWRIGLLIVSEKAHEPKRSGRCPKFLGLKYSDLYVVVIKSAAISAAFSFVMALGESCSPASKTYSSVPPSLAAPRHRNNSTDLAGRISKRVIRIVARRSILGGRKTGAPHIKVKSILPLGPERTKSALA
jgi:hypothetical protein